MPALPETMRAAYLPGDGTVELKTVPVPKPGHGEVVIKMKASTICGSDMKFVYKRKSHPFDLGPDFKGYEDVVCGHEPCGVIAECGPGLRRFKEEDRVLVYHISGCGVCDDCRRGYMICCMSPWRRAYGWQRDGGMAEYLLAEEKDLIPLPEPLSYVDGAQTACGFGTVYEGLSKIGVSGDDAVLVVGLGPVGMAACMLAKAMGADKVIGVDISSERLALVREKGLADVALKSDNGTLAAVRHVTGGKGCEKTVDCSGSAQGRLLAIQATRNWGKSVMIGEDGEVTFRPSADFMHEHKTLYGSWVTSTWHMEELTERMVRWGIHPDSLITTRLPLERVGEGFALMDEGKCGKVALCFDEELA